MPQDVAEHYLSLSVDELIGDVLRHYQGMWANIEMLVRSADRLVIEGSALWPESADALSDLSGVAALWLTADSELLEARIRAESRYDEGTATEKALVEKFIGRTVRYDELMMEAINKLGLESIDAGTSSIDELMQQCLHLVAESRGVASSDICPRHGPNVTADGPASSPYMRH